MTDEVRLFIALYTDADVNKSWGLNPRAGFDAISALEVQNNLLDDEPQLEYATSQGRTILTHNQRDFAPLHEKWQREGREHAGIILSVQIPIGELLRRTLNLLNQVTADEIHNNLRHLSDFAERRK